MAPVLETRGLVKQFGGIVATNDVTLAVEKGARHALIGPHGAGKTTIINLPTAVLRDEPAAGVPEAERHGILDAVAALPSDVTVLLIEHDMDLVFSFADRISVLVNGALFVEGPPEEVAQDARVKAVYLGEEAHDA